MSWSTTSLSDTRLKQAYSDNEHKIKRHFKLFQMRKLKRSIAVSLPCLKGYALIFLRFVSHGTFFETTLKKETSKPWYKIYER
jgi:hypothetical protein